MKFDKKYLIDLVYSDNDDVIENELIESDRWTLLYRMIFKCEDKFYETFYRTSATEMQDEHPYEFDPDTIECYEVVPVEKTIISYERIKENESKRSEKII